jgi:hypothetical protein
VGLEVPLGFGIGTGIQVIVQLLEELFTSKQKRLPLSV